MLANSSRELVLLNAVRIEPARQPRLLHCQLYDEGKPLGLPEARVPVKVEELEIELLQCSLGCAIRLRACGYRGVNSA